MLVIKPRGGGRKIYRYGGSGIFDAITKKLFSNGLKTAIKSGAKSVIVQKVADAVVNGATNATKKAVEDTVNDAINRRIWYHSRLKCRRQFYTFKKNLKSMIRLKNMSMLNTNR